jgi:hypothetical protein
MNMAAVHAHLPSFNSGIFAMKADSQSWLIWQEILTRALAHNFHFLAEQQSLNLAIHDGLIPISKQPRDANYTCHHELPWFSVRDGVFTFPNDESHVVGTIHLCDAKKHPLLPIPRFPDGSITPMPMYYRLVQQIIRGIDIGTP